MFNLTPHAIVLRPASGPDLTIPASGLLARVATGEETVGECAGLPLVRRTMGAVHLPDGLPEEGLLLVSSLVLEAAKAQGHPALARMVAPDTGPTAVREGGQVKAVTRLVVA